VTDGRLSIQQVNGTTVPVDVSTVRRLEIANRPANAASWHGALNAGVDVSRGNSETSTISTTAAFTRLAPRDRLGLFGRHLFSAIGSGANSVTTARVTGGGLRYDHDPIGPLYGFAFGDAENDPLQLLDLRTVVGGGGGAHVLKSDATQFNLFGGVSYARDAYAAAITTTTTTTTSPPATTTGPRITPPGQGGTPPGLSGVRPTRGGTPPAVVRTSLSREVGEFLVGQDLTHQLSDSVSLTEGLTIFPATNDVNDYRVSFDLSLWAQINSWLQWNVTVADRYLNIPPAGGAVQNDTFVSTGLGITFGRGDSGTYGGSDGRRPPSTRKQ
jgi:putative salt-induced outer membrane protein